jgi:hypothetical protein
MPLERSGREGDDALVLPRGGAAAPDAGASLMGRRSPQSVLKRAREQALREKRELKQAKKDARTAQRRSAADPAVDAADADAKEDAG